MTRPQRARHTAAAAAEPARVDVAAAAESIHTTAAAAAGAASLMHSTQEGGDRSTTETDALSALASLSCEIGDFDRTVAAIRAQDSAARLRAFADACQQKEGVMRTPVVLLQLLALMRQYECLSPITGTVAERAASAELGRGLEAHGSYRTAARR